MSDALDSSTGRAIVTLGVTFVVAWTVNWLLGRQLGRLVRRLPGSLPGDEAALRTRWQTLRRALVTVIVVVGVLAAAWNFDATSTLARTALASSAVLALIVGLAAQTPLSNAVSGILLALNQPIRIGDRVTVDGYSGVVEEVGLTATHLRADDGRQIIFPNSILTQRTIENATIRGGRGRAVVRIPAPVGTDVEQLRERVVALAADAGLHEPESVVADLSSDGVVVEVRGWADGWSEARAAEEQLRAAAAALVPSRSEA
jgi:small conductance mechanosensitive channel